MCATWYGGLVSCADDAVGGVVGSAAGAVTDTALQSFADSVKEALSGVFADLLTFWLNGDSPAVDSSSAIVQLQRLVLPYALALVMGGLLWQATRLVALRKADPALNILQGLLTYLAGSAVGLVLLGTLLRLADDITPWFLSAGDAEEFRERMGAVLGLQAVTQPGLVILLGVLIFFVGAAQWVALLLRQGAIIVLAVFIPLAAAGGFSPATRPWLRRIAAWLLSLALYKPLVALIYAVGFTLVGDGESLHEVMTGFVVLVLSVVALPALLKFFSWGVDAGAGRLGGSGSGLLGGTLAVAGAGAAVAGAASMRGGSAAEQASQVSRDMGPSAASAVPAAGPAAPSGAATAGGAGMAGGAASASPYVAAAQAAVAVGTQVKDKTTDAMTTPQGQG